MSISRRGLFGLAAGAVVAGPKVGESIVGGMVDGAAAPSLATVLEFMPISKETRQRIYFHATTQWTREEIEILSRRGQSIVSKFQAGLDA